MARVVTMAVPLSGNRGSSSMLLSIIQNLDKELGDVHYDVFTYYPRVDQGKNKFPNVAIWDGTPFNILLHLVPLSFAYFLLALVGINGKFILSKELKAILDCDIYLAVGGTTFNDAKLIKVGFNVLCLLPAIFLKRKLVLYTQTMGPFEKAFNRIMAKTVLPCADLVIGRGKGSYEHLKNLGLKKIDYATDGAFSLSETDAERHIRDKYTPLLSGKKTVGISPNSIVVGYCNKVGIDHAGIFAAFIDWLVDEGYYPVLIPHSIKPYSKNRHNNDLPIIDDILKCMKKPDSVLYVKDDYSYLELRTLIGMLDYYVASRFHSMISALYTRRPVIVFGWGYQKYAEIMDEFELSAYVMSFKDIKNESLKAGFNSIVKDKDIIVEKINRCLPAVMDSSRRANKLIADILKNQNNPAR